MQGNNLPRHADKTRTLCSRESQSSLFFPESGHASTDLSVKADGYCPYIRDRISGADMMAKEDI